MKQIIFLFIFLSGFNLANASSSITSLSSNSATLPPNSRQLNKLGLKQVKLHTLKNGIWKIEHAGKTTGYVINSQEFTNNIKGFNGPTPLLIYVDEKGRIKKIYALPNSETPAYFQKALSLLHQFLGKSAPKCLKAKVDGVSGATYSSNSLIKNVKAALAAYDKNIH